MKKTMLKVFAIAAAAAVAGCCCSAARKCAAPQGGITKHVVLVGVDGLGARYIPWEKMPNLKALCADGAYATARCTFPTASGINWASIMYGTLVEIHGYRHWNSKKPEVPAFHVTEEGIPPCIFSEIRRQDPGAFTAALYNWDGIGFCLSTNSASCAEFFSKGTLKEIDDATMARGLELIAEKHPALTFVYQHLTDCMGHQHGWGTAEYTNACVNVDKNLGRLRDALAKDPEMADAVVILVSDHGGIGKKHGSADIECFEIPFAVGGAPVRGMALREPVMNFDTAPTIAWLLGYRVPEEWRGRPALK